MEISPRTIIFPSVTPGSTYTARVVVRNTAHRSARIRVKSVSEYLRVNLLDWLPIAPGMTGNIFVEFEFRNGESMPRELDGEFKILSSEAVDATVGVKIKRGTCVQL